MLSLGAYPAVSLANAREKRNDARKLLAAGTDPSRQRKLDRYASAAAARNTFGAIAAEYLANMKAQKASERTVSKNRWLLEGLAAPLGDRPIAAIMPVEILDVLKRVEKGGRQPSNGTPKAASSSVV